MLYGNHNIGQIAQWGILAFLLWKIKVEAFYSFAGSLRYFLYFYIFSGLIGLIRLI